MFTALGFGELVERARGGVRRSELAQSVPLELIQQVCATGSPAEVLARISDYHSAGAEVVGVAPSTAGDPDGRNALGALSGGWKSRGECARSELHGTRHEHVGVVSRADDEPGVTHRAQPLGRRRLGGVVVGEHRKPVIVESRHEMGDVDAEHEPLTDS